MRDTLAFTANSTEGTVTNTPNGTQLYLNFDSKRHIIATSGAVTEIYRIALIPGTREVYFKGSDGLPVQAHKISAKMLDALLGI